MKNENENTIERNFKIRKENDFILFDLRKLKGKLMILMILILEFESNGRINSLTWIFFLDFSLFRSKMIKILKNQLSF